MKTKIFILSILFSLNSLYAEVSLKSLLTDIVSRDQQATFPKSNYKCKQFSSYSRRAVSPENGWFSNWDWSNFLRIEKTNGRREFVMMDHQGPGAIVRFWMTFARGGHDGRLRIYLDGAEKPAIEGNVLKLLSGGQIVGSPLSSSSSDKTGYLQRGHNLYLPIPYAKSCKVTIETNDLQEPLDANNHSEGPYVYYNINYRDYPKGTSVETFSMEELKKQSALTSKVNETLLIPSPDKSVLNNKEWTLNLKASQKESIVIKGAKAIKTLSVKLDAKDLSQALRSTVLSVKFDGKETIWVPVGDFFGTGYKISPYKSWYTQVTADGTLNCSWVMPFRKKCELKFINFGKQNVKVSATVATDSWNWNKNSLYFHSSWFEKNRVKTVAHQGHTGEGAEDVNFVTVKGKGVYVGDSLTLFNAADGHGGPWWGEGDEKVYVDGEGFPSHFGTGTEDYYGYAWCRPEKFHTPFIAQPDGSGDLASGFTINSRYRLLDNIPFTKSLKFDMELWHWQKTTMNYAPAVFYYASKASLSNATKDVNSVKEKVVLTRADMFPPVLVDGKIEGEALQIVGKTGGHVSPQGLSGDWSGNSQLWWRNGKVGDELSMNFVSKKAYKGPLTLSFTIANDYAIVDLYLNDKLIKKGLDLYSNELNRKAVSIPATTINMGNNLLEVKITGHNKKAKPSLMFGLDIISTK